MEKLGKTAPSEELPDYKTGVEQMVEDGNKDIDEKEQTDYLDEVSKDIETNAVGAPVENAGNVMGDESGETSEEVEALLNAELENVKATGEKEKKPRNPEKIKDAAKGVRISSAKKVITNNKEAIKKKAEEEKKKNPGWTLKEKIAFGLVAGAVGIILITGIASNMQNKYNPNTDNRPGISDSEKEKQNETLNYDGSFNQIGVKGKEHNRAYEKDENGVVSYNEKAYSTSSFGEFAGEVKDANGNILNGKDIDKLSAAELEAQVPAAKNLEMMRETSLRQPTSIAIYANKVPAEVWRANGLGFVADNMNNPNALADLLMEGGTNRADVEKVWQVLDENWWDKVDVEYGKIGGAESYYTTGLRNGNTEDAYLVTGKSNKERTVIIFTIDGKVVGKATPTCSYQPIDRPNVPEVPGDPQDPETPPPETPPENPPKTVLTPKNENGTPGKSSQEHDGSINTNPEADKSPGYVSPNNPKPEVDKKPIEDVTGDVNPNTGQKENTGNKDTTKNPDEKGNEYQAERPF